MSEYPQRNGFISGEGDAWFRRNPVDSGPRSYRDRVLPYLKPGDRVLEVGTCDGRNLAWLKGQVAVETFGVDPSDSAIASGKRLDPSMDLRVGMADNLPFQEGIQFDLVWLGFFMYLVDRELLTRVVAESDRVLKDGGFLVIHDFDVKRGVSHSYHHRAGINSYKLNYANLFLAFPHFHLAEKVPIQNGEVGFEFNEADRIALWVLSKSLEAESSSEH